jgi:hypothetical protein
MLDMYSRQDSLGENITSKIGEMMVEQEIIVMGDKSVDECQAVQARRLLIVKTRASCVVLSTRGRCCFLGGGQRARSLDARIYRQRQHTVLPLRDLSLLALTGLNGSSGTLAARAFI